MASSDKACANGDCDEHYHAHDTIFIPDETKSQSKAQLIPQRTSSTEPHSKESADNPNIATEQIRRTQEPTPACDPADHGFRRIIRNFTPSWFIITMSTGILSIIIHQLPYHAHWLDILSYIFFVLNLTLFLLFSFISILRYTLYPEIFPAVMRHPHQSLFVATFPIGLATLINMIVLVCVPAWGQGWAVLAWVLWWIDSVLALVGCFQLTFVIMSNRRSELAEMTALYLIPIVAVVIAANSGGLVAGVLPNPQHQLWTLLISYIFWGIGSPLSWIVLTVYFLRMTVHKPLKREVIVSLLVPIGPLGLEGFSIIALGKLSQRLFPTTQTFPNAANAGEIFYAVGLMLGVTLWGFAIVWFVVAVMMIVVCGRFPFNMGWWGFIFPIGVFTLLTIALGEELESKFFKVLSCVLLVVCIIMWLVVAAGTVRGVLSGKMFFAPCLGTDLYLKKAMDEKFAAKAAKETV